MWVKLRFPFFDGLRVYPYGVSEISDGTTLPSDAVILEAAPVEPAPPPTLDTLFELGKTGPQTIIAEPNKETTFSELGKKK
jgi:hypothetical protein